jgi:hypothetical protein
MAYAITVSASTKKQKVFEPSAPARDKMKILLIRSHNDRSVFDGLSRREIIGWVVCMALAVGLTLFGGAYLASSYMSADVSSVLRSDSAKRSQQQTP